MAEDDIYRSKGRYERFLTNLDDLKLLSKRKNE